MGILKNFLFLSVFLFFSSVHSVEFNSCQNLVSGNYELNQSLYFTGNCLNITGNNVILDCQDNTLTGDGTNYGVNIFGNFSTITRCNFNNFSRGISSIGSVLGSIYYYSEITNNNFNNSNYGIYTSYSRYYNISSNIIQNVNSGMYIVDMQPTYFNIKNNTITNNNYGIRFIQARENNVSKNIVINNSFYNLVFQAFSGGSYTNLIYDNNLGDISKIFSSNWLHWENHFNFSTQGNIYSNSSGAGTDIIYCFDGIINDNCDNHATIIQSSSQIEKKKISRNFLLDFHIYHLY